MAIGVLWAAYTVASVILFLLPGDPVQTVDTGATAPVVPNVTTLRVVAGVHGLRFDAPSRINLYDTWKS